MPSFVKKIFYNSRELDVHFSEIIRLTSSRFYITVVEDAIVVASFDMKKDGDEQWIICPPAPEWVLDAAPILSKCIYESQ